MDGIGVYTGLAIFAAFMLILVVVSLSRILGILQELREHFLPDKDGPS